MKKIIQILSVVAIMLMGMGILTEATAQSSSAESNSITLTEYSDYQCPACGYFHPIVKKLKDKFGEQIQLELKFYPLNSHQFAALAARAAQAAKNQGKFLEMHNLIFKNQKHWSSAINPTPIFEGYAKKIGLDMEQFRKELNAAATQKAVMEEKQEGINKGVNSTPTFFIDGKEVSPLPRTYKEFEKVIKKHLEQKS